VKKSIGAALPLQLGVDDHWGSFRYQHLDPWSATSILYLHLSRT
jgi:hypothetical protein